MASFSLGEGLPWTGNKAETRIPGSGVYSKGTASNTLDVPEFARSLAGHWEHVCFFTGAGGGLSDTFALLRLTCQVIPPPPFSVPSPDYRLHPAPGSGLPWPHLGPDCELGEHPLTAVESFCKMINAKESLGE
ncbi:hypothetical protein MG293_003318 [Ovis ammon polii]|uniref:Uncharacterized protein n=1 Tax=Ovis ammon polii TaxID=230172 RepID=A0AAD4YGD3_OVIAM|nr:hypothetical protein MG293_003318 [Ovis ammon polii]KAI4576962.1 hypothetical protein MJT46_002797 [Ovis ammon polii x Ovis aries]